MKAKTVGDLEYLAIGGNKSVVILLQKGGKLAPLVECVNIHTGPVIDLCFTDKSLITGSIKDRFVQMITATDASEEQLSKVSNQAQIQNLDAKLAAEYDSTTQRVFKLPSIGYRRISVSPDHQFAFASGSAKGVTRVPLNGMDQTKVFVEGRTNPHPDKQVNELTSLPGRLIVEMGGDNAIKVFDSNFNQLDCIQGREIAFLNEAQLALRKLKYSESEACIVWMPQPGKIELLDPLTSKRTALNDLKLPAEYVLLCGIAYQKHKKQSVVMLMDDSKKTNMLVYFNPARETTVQSQSKTIYTKEINLPQPDKLARDILGPSQSVGNTLSSVATIESMDYLTSGESILVSGSYEPSLPFSNMAPVALIQLGTSLLVGCTLNLDDRVPSSAGRSSSPPKGKGLSNSSSPGKGTGCTIIRRVHEKDIFLAACHFNVHIIKVNGLDLEAVLKFRHCHDGNPVADLALVNSRVYTVSESDAQIGEIVFH